MTDRLTALEDWAAGLLEQLEPAARRRLARGLGKTLRHSQQQRIRSQRNGDGTQYIPRKPRNLRAKAGRVKRKTRMFKRLQTARFLKLRTDSDGVTVGYSGRAAGIGRVHQFGLKAQAEKGAPFLKYSAREILSFTAKDLDEIRTALLAQLNRSR
ncbi:phage virion morphogenesis protein [Pseudomonas prosekii]|uniref:Phage virion morphogenesis protein n=1 Tax=Pseudomonas prosekii TaxID=1148509 RepID=A0A2U2DBE6_9PSED|nr:phage virion morphogenesis protein [Pseudomonas prosekii]PWE46674.1 phage virion morphogenesis protein [Pseudomonas prosekii]